MDTYFLVVAELNNSEVVYGPYVTFQQATEILAEHLRDFLVVELNGKSPRSYVARIDEITNTQGKWVKLETRLEDQFGE